MSVPEWHTLHVPMIPVDNEMRRFAKRWKRNRDDIMKALGIAGQHMAREFRSAGWIR